MNPCKVVVHMEQRHHVDVVVDFLRERIGQPSKAPHVHSHVQVLALDVAGRDVGLIGITADGDTLGAKTLRRAVTALRLGSGMHYRFSISKWNRDFIELFRLFLCGCLRAPSLLGGLCRDLCSALLGHRLQAALPADLAALAAHFGHYKGNRGSADGDDFKRRLGSVNRFIENPLGILSNVKSFVGTCASAFLHYMTSVARNRAPRQLEGFSN